MKKILFLLLALALPAISLAATSSVTRSFSADTVDPGKEITVTLAVDVGGKETFYAIDEILPAGWVVKDKGTGATEQAGHIKWVVIQDAKDTTYTYTVTAPSGGGQANFGGKNIFEGQKADQDTVGAKTVTVTATQASAQTGDQAATTTSAGWLGTSSWLVWIIIVIIVVALTIFSRRKKRSEGKEFTQGA